ncbi:UDP-N-acetylmuramate dehydrogenase [Bogoriella caseilytica]|uniref:UDP-N-acetylenolpyruvoylglucosamine reductase n=1 Tax=Bogoriella caseilytica TaxID=56055 RepID=A0A3N2BEN9_9MICO|nr:UDP-N-acetylmuramate dehydrogenase [Bogoriella caseilytica]
MPASRPGPAPGAAGAGETHAPSVPPRLADLTTMRVGGPAASYLEATTEAELIDAVRQADAEGTPLLVIGGGSNLLVADEGFDGLVLRDIRSGIDADASSACSGGNLTVPAGQDWDELVATAVAEEWSGIEALSGIPGGTGATPVQNVGAYGQEVSQTLASVRVYDRATSRIRTLAASELGLGYRTSILKRSRLEDEARWHPTGRYVVLEVSFQLRLASLSAPVRYAELARRLGVDVEARVPSSEVRAAVLELRGSKGMVLDAADHDTWSAGSFFTNPVLPIEDADRLLPADAPRYPVADHSLVGWNACAAPAVDGLVKTSAAWLIDHAGFSKGHRGGGASGGSAASGPAALSSKHVLALTNRGGATAADMVALAREIRDGVRQRFGVDLEPEPVLIGVEL